MEKFLSMFVDIDTRVIYIAVVVILIAGLLAVIKKAVKLGIIVLIIALLVGYGGSFLNSIKERYDFSINGTELYVRVMNNEYNIELVDKGNKCTGLATEMSRWRYMIQKVKRTQLQ